MGPRLEADMTCTSAPSAQCCCGPLSAWRWCLCLISPMFAACAATQTIRTHTTSPRSPMVRCAACCPSSLTRRRPLCSCRFPCQASLAFRWTPSCWPAHAISPSTRSRCCALPVWPRVHVVLGPIGAVCLISVFLRVHAGVCGAGERARPGSQPLPQRQRRAKRSRQPSSRRSSRSSRARQVLSLPRP